MKKPATISSKIQITIPAEVRAALGLRAGETVVFDFGVGDGSTRVTLRRPPTLEEIAGTVPVPEDVAPLSWQEIRARAWAPSAEW